LADADATLVVETDLPCVRCRYNLRTLSWAGHCPECGVAVELSLGRRWRPGVTRWLALGVVMWGLASLQPIFHQAAPVAIELCDGLAARWWPEAVGERARTGRELWWPIVVWGCGARPWLELGAFAVFAGALARAGRGRWRCSIPLILGVGVLVMDWLVEHCVVRSEYARGHLLAGLELSRGLAGLLTWVWLIRLSREFGIYGRRGIAGGLLLLALVRIVAAFFLAVLSFFVPLSGWVEDLMMYDDELARWHRLIAVASYGWDAAMYLAALNVLALAVWWRGWRAVAPVKGHVVR
jgi:hypothetical protein